MVSTSLIVTMWIAAGILLAVSLALPLLVDGHVEFTLSALFLGVIMFAAFDAILLDLFDTIVLKNFSAEVYEKIYSSDWLYVTYYTFIHAFFYIIGFYTVARMGFRVDKSGTGVAIGLGAGGARAIMSGAWPLVTRVVTAARINKIGVDALIADATESEVENLRAAAQSLMNSVPMDVVWSCIETLLMFAILVAIAVIVHIAATHRGPIWLIGIGFLLLLAMFAPPAMFTMGMFESVPLLECSLLLVAAASAAVAIPVAKKYMDNPLKV